MGEGERESLMDRKKENVSVDRDYVTNVISFHKRVFTDLKCLVSMERESDREKQTYRESERYRK